VTRRIVLFGAGEAGRRVLQNWPDDRPVSYVVDNDWRKWGTSFGNLTIHSPATLDAEPFGSVFVAVASQWGQDIARQLEAMGLRARDDFASHGDALSLLRRPVRIDAPCDATAVVVEDYWFGLDYVRLAERLARWGIRYLPARTPGGHCRVDIAVEPETCRSARVHGVPLYDACLFDVCVACGVTPEQVDPLNAGHWSVIDQHLHCAAALVRIAAKLLDQERPDVVVIPQGHTTTAAVYRYLAILRGIRVLALENSLNRSRLVWDDLAGIAVNRIAARNHYWRWADLIDADRAASYVASFLASIKQTKSDDHQSPATPWRGDSGGRPIVLYLANVLTDSSVLFNSHVGSQIDAIKATARWALANDCTFVLKIHPRERPGSPVLHRPFPPASFSFEGLTFRALKQDEEFATLMAESDGCVIDVDNRFDTYDLIRRASVCVTICSQAGFEALLLGKETVVLGNAYYAGVGVTHDVQHPDDLPRVLAAALDPTRRRADATTVARFFYAFDRLYCVEKSVEGVAELIARTLGRAPLAMLPDVIVTSQAAGAASGR
jgi:hypothetical protein